MLTKDNLSKQIKIIAQDAWKVETHTTMNSMMEYIVKEVASLLLDEIDSVKLCLADLVEKKSRSRINGSKDGGIQKPEWSAKALNEIRRAKTRKDDDSGKPLSGVNA